MTLTEQIQKAEGQGLRLLGFYVAPDVYGALCRVCDRVKDGPGTLVPTLATELAPFMTGIIVMVSDLLPAGHVAPYFSEPQAMLPNGEDK